MTPFSHHQITHLSASSINLFAAQPALWVMERLIKKTQYNPGAAAHRGTAVEAGVVKGLFEGTSVEDCQAHAVAQFDQLCALSGDPKRDKERENIPGMVKQALGELRQYGKPSGTQQKVSIEHPELPVPIIGYTDLEWSDHGIIVDLKTTTKLPSDITDAHCRQGSIYIHGTNKQMRFCYTTPSKIGVYALEDAETHFRSVIAMAKRMERFLGLSKDPQELAALLVPDFSSFYWNDPVTRAHGREVYGF